MELSEATALADRFITSLVFKVHSLPESARSEWAKTWWQGHGARIPLQPALEEQRRRLSHFASRRRGDRQRDRQVILTLSAIVNDDKRGRCPALAGTLCGIYDRRPLTCRTVPMHYSRPPSVLSSYLDRFTSTPDYRCDTSPTAPVVLDGNTILDPALRFYRDEAVSLARSERGWKARIIAVMDDASQAEAAGLPTYDAVMHNSDSGYATVLPMLVAWRVAGDEALLSSNALRDIYEKQIALIRSEIGQHADPYSPSDLPALLLAYETELASTRRSDPANALIEGRAAN